MNLNLFNGEAALYVEVERIKHSCVLLSFRRVDERDPVAWICLDLRPKPPIHIPIHVSTPPASIHINQGLIPIK